MTTHLGVELLSAYLDRELPVAQRQRLEQHLEGCPQCREQLISLQGVVRRLRLLERAAPPPFLATEVTHRVSLARGAERARTLSEQLQVRPLQPGQQSALFLAFSLVVALVAILYLFASGADHLERDHAPRVVVVEATLAWPLEVEVAGRRFRREGDRFRQVELAAGRVPGAVVDADSDLGRELLASSPGLGLLLEERRAVLLEATDGQVVELRRGAAGGMRAGSQS